jgi:Cthe_2314-like HEPN
MIMTATVGVLVARATFISRDAEPQWHRNGDAIFAKVNDLWRTLDELEDLLGLLRAGGSCVHVRLLIKLYHVGVATLNDVLAGLINEVFDLGYRARDVSLENVLRNRHIVDADIPQVLGKHAETTQKLRFSQIRNDIVHRNKLVDAELDKLCDQEANLMSSALLFHEGVGDSSPKVYFAREAEKTGHASAIRDLAASRAQELSDHLAATKTMLADVDVPLARHIRDST